MKRILVIFSHPALQSSRANKQLLHAIEGLEGITLHDLCQRYPDMFINVKREQALLAEHDIIVFQHPFYWYSCPAIMKEWMDLVLEYGYAYGPEAHALSGKQWLSAITTGGAPESYCSEGYNQRPLLDFLLPFQQTAQLCGMQWLPPLSGRCYPAGALGMESGTAPLPLQTVSAHQHRSDQDALGQIA